MFWLMKIILWIPFTILFPTRMLNKKKIPKGKVIFVCNHLSNIDYIYLFNKIWRKQFVMAKEELFKGKLITKFFRSCGGIPVNRENVQLATIKDSLAVLKKGKILTIFPEGTRNKTSEPLLEFKAGASIFAVKSGAPIIPIIITKKPRPFVLNKIIVGDPIYFDNSYKGEEGTAKANQEIRDKMLEMKSN